MMVKIRTRVGAQSFRISVFSIGYDRGCQAPTPPYLEYLQALHKPNQNP